MTSERLRADGPPFAMVPERLLFDPTIDPLAKAVYGVLLRLGSTPDACWPSHAWIAARLGVSDRSIARPVRLLEERGWVRRETRPGTSSGYWVRYDPALTSADSTEPRAQERGDPALTSAPTPRSGARLVRANDREPGEREREEGPALTLVPSPTDAGSTLPAVVEGSPHLAAAHAVCDLLAERLAERGERIAPGTPRSKGWVVAAEAMFRIDGRDPRRVAAMVEYLHAGQDRVSAFWRPNVRSPAKLRAHYARIAEEANTARQGAPRSAAIHRPDERSVEELLAMTKPTTTTTVGAIDAVARRIGAHA